MINLKIYQICHHLITYFATLISPKKGQLGPIFRTGGSIIFLGWDCDMIFPNLFSSLSCCSSTLAFSGKFLTSCYINFSIN